MTEFAVGSEVSWIEHYKHEKIFFSNAMENVLLRSGDGLSCFLPKHVLLASSKLVQDIARRGGEQDLEIILPSVSGSALCTLVELLRCGISSIKGGVGSINVESIKQVQLVMKMLSIEGGVSVAKNLMAGHSKVEVTDIGSEELQLGGDHAKVEVTDIGSEQMEVGEGQGDIGSRQMKECSRCDRLFMFTAERKRHLLSHVNSEMDRHMANYIREPPYPCFLCDVEIRDWTSLRRHIAFTHNLLTEWTSVTQNELDGNYEGMGGGGGGATYSNFIFS